MRVRPSAEDFAGAFFAADDDFLAAPDFVVFVDLAVVFLAADDDFLAAALDVFFFVASSLIGEAVSNTGEILITPHLYFFRKNEVEQKAHTLSCSLCRKRLYYAKQFIKVFLF